LPRLSDEDFETWEAIHDLVDRPYTCILLWAYHSVQEIEGDQDVEAEFRRLCAISPSPQADELWDIAHRAYIFEWNDEGWLALMEMVFKGYDLWVANGYALHGRTA
jgi:hypothetical protein